MKSFTLSFVAACAVVSVALIAGGQQASAFGSSERSLCIKDAAAYLAATKIDAPIMTLVEASRTIYPEITQMIEDDVPSDEYEQKLQKLGPQVGCEKIEEHVQMISDLVPCYNEMETDENGLLDIARADEAAKKIIEAYFACTFAKSD